jgi:nitrilase
MIVDPWGEIVAVLTDGPGFVIGEIDLDYLSRVRRELPCLAHRRLS